MTYMDVKAESALILLEFQIYHPCPWSCVSFFRECLENDFPIIAKVDPSTRFAHPICHTGDLCQVAHPHAPADACLIYRRQA